MIGTLDRVSGFSKGGRLAAPTEALQRDHTLHMRYHYAFLAITTAAALSCSGYDESTAPPPPPAPPPPGPTVLLKDVVIPNLPSPFYHFEYDAAGRVSRASFASGFTMYEVAYVNGRIGELRNNTAGNQDRLQYFYDNAGRVRGIDYVDPTGALRARIALAYNGQQLIGLERARRAGHAFIIDKIMSMTYHPDGNLLEISDHRPAIDGLQTESTVIHRYEQYDDGINVDGFDLIHNEFFDHLILLPGVQLQKGNPARLTQTVTGQNFIIDYSYTYDDQKRPLTKTGEGTFLSGPDAGERFHTHSVFTYY